MRETGLEPVRCNHTPLKRARLPVPPLSHVPLYRRRDILYYLFTKKSIPFFDFLLKNCIFPIGDKILIVFRDFYVYFCLDCIKILYFS